MGKIFPAARACLRWCFWQRLLSTYNPAGGCDAPVLTGLTPAVYTATFIAMRNGEEVGHITGYPGPGFICEELHTLLAHIGFAPVDTSRGRPC